MSVIIFAIARAVPGDPVDIMLPLEADQATRDNLRRQLGVDKNLATQYVIWAGNVLKGDFGYSYRYRQDSFSLFRQRFPATIQLALAALALTAAVGIPVGIMSAVGRGGWMDSVAKVFAMAGQSMPTFLVGLIAILIFGVHLKLLPVYGRGGPENLIMPAVSLGWFSMAAVTRLTRSSMLNVLDSEYIKMARIKGLPERVVIWKHALRNASIPILTLVSLQFGALLGGAVIIEKIFSWPGVGSLAVDAVFARDYPTVQTVVVITSTIWVMVNLVVDILYAYVDPRIRYG